MTAEDHHAHVEEVIIGDDAYSFVQADSTPDTTEVHEIRDTPDIRTEDTKTFQQSDNSTFTSHRHTSTEKPAGTFTDYGTANLTKVALPALFRAMLPKPGDVINGLRSVLPTKAEMSGYAGSAYDWTRVNGSHLYSQASDYAGTAYKDAEDWYSTGTKTGSEYLAEGSQKVSEMTSQLGQSDARSASQGVLSSMWSFAGDHPYALALAGTASVGAMLWARGGKKGKKGKTSVRSSRTTVGV